MARFRLLHATCTIALLAATPALAGRPEAGMTNAAGQANPEDTQTQHPATGSKAPANSGANTMSKVKPASSAMASHPTHRSAMNHSGGKIENDADQDAAVNRLNDESYQASHMGQAFRVSHNDSGPAAAPGGTSAPGSAMPSNVSGGGGGKP